MPLLFSYGTLRDPAVQLELFGRHVHGVAAELLGYRRSTHHVTDAAFAARSGSETHAIAHFTGDDDDRVAGMALELTDADLRIADAYEPPGYSRVIGRLASGDDAWVYVATRK